MEVYSLPVTRSSGDIKDSFLQQLALKLNIKEKPVKKLQIIIFKPTGRPRDEFDNLIRVFKAEGGRLDEDVIFITAIKVSRCQFEPPADYNFVLQTSVYLTDENKLDPRSNAAMDNITDLLILKYGFQPYLHGNPWHNDVSKKAEFPIKPKSKGEDADKGQEMHPPVEETIRLKRIVEELGQEVHALTQENKRLKMDYKENGQETGALKEEIILLKENYKAQGQEVLALEEGLKRKYKAQGQKVLEFEEVLKRKDKEHGQETGALQQEIICLKEHYKEHEQETGALQQEIISLKENYKEHWQKTDALKQEIISLKENYEAKGQEVLAPEEGLKRKYEEVHAFTQPPGRIDEANRQEEIEHEENRQEEIERLIETHQEEFIQEIRFKKKKTFLNCCSGEQMINVNLRAIENEIKRMSKGEFDFQRKCEMKFQLKPGNLQDILEYIRNRLQTQDVSRSVIEDHELKLLIEEMTSKFELTEDHFNSLLYKIYKRNKRNKRGDISSQGEYGSLLSFRKRRPN